MKKYPISQPISGPFINPNLTDWRTNNLNGYVFRIISRERSHNDFLSQFQDDNRQMFEITDFRTDGQVSSFNRVYENLEIFTSTEYNYDEKHNIQSEISYDEEQNIIAKTFFRFDEMGKMIEEFKEHADLRSTAIYAHGLLERVRVFSKTQNCDNMYIIKRNELDSNKIVEIILDNKISELHHTFYEYDANNNVCREYRQKGNEAKVLKKTIEYDNFNNPIKTIFKNRSSDSLYSYDYTFDEHNNWTNLSVRENGELITEINRKYYYYKLKSKE